jgi:hypothetical protein
MKTKKQQIKQKIVAACVALFMFVMVFGSINIDVIRAIGTNTTLIQNIVPGTLSMEAPATLGFNNINLGTPINSLANMTQVNARDLRGTGVAWSVTGTMNNLTTAGAGVNNISNAVIAWAPGGFFADNGSNAGVALGTAGFFDSVRTIINTSVNNGMGNYKIVNTTMNVVYNGNPNFVAGTYQNTLTMTIQ